MARCAAFLRGLNVGGHRVKMADLRAHVEALGLSEVGTVLASGNLVLTCPDDEVAGLEARLAAGLEAALGYAVPTMVRPAAEVERAAAFAPFPEVPEAAAATLHVLFLSAAPSTDARTAIEALATDEDRLRVDGRELWWLRFGRLMDTTLDEKALARALAGLDTTQRTAATVRKVAAKL